MESSLTETIWFSEKRRKILLLLLDGPKKPEEMKKAFNVAWRSLILPLKELKEAELVCNPGETYELSYIGKLLAETIKPINGILKLFEKDTDYWAKRDLDAIPKYLLDRIGEIEDCIIVEPELNDMFEPPAEFTERLLHSKYVHSVFSIYHPLYPPLYSELAEKGTEVSIVLTQSVMQRMLEDEHKELQKMRTSQNTKLFLYEEDLCPPSIVVTNKLISASFFNINGRYDHRDIISFDESSLKWGETMFEHCKNIATEI